jgi:alginate O-acetyltransferase complex protein AlgI
MLFNSFNFIFFFAVIILLYYLLPHRYRWALLLLGSCYFYMAFIPVYILILGFTIVVDYIAGIYLEKITGKNKKLFLIASLIANIGVLAVFKYYIFLNDNLTSLLGVLNLSNRIPSLAIILPIGLSFHTFQAMSYTIEVYRGHQKAEKNFGIYALYVMFFPQLVAGPIERPQNLLHQFYEKHTFDSYRVTEGLKLMLWGYFKKLVIADRLAIYVNSVYNNPHQHNGTTLIVATIFFAFQIYCDFSGYSDIAIGTAKILGFRLMLNFNRPYFSRNISEFWKRWHISLSSWFRDYLYISLGGNRVSVPRWYVNLFIVFLISGIWHGANWTFVMWGALNGFYLIFAIVTNNLRTTVNTRLGLAKFPRIHQFIEVVLTFFLSGFAWIFFRSNSIQDAFYIIKTMITGRGSLFSENPSILIYSVFGILFLLGIEFMQEYFPGRIDLFHHKSMWVRNLTYTALIVLILLVGVFDGGQFIYFQF